MNGARQLVAVLGGTFDPFHNGHAYILAAARVLPVAKVLVVPNGSPGYRPTVASWRDRWEMTRLGAPTHVEVAELEPPGAPRCTVDTALLLRSQGRQPIFILGSDAFAALSSWDRWEELFELMSWAVIPRAEQGDWLPAEPVARVRAQASQVAASEELIQPGKVWRWPLKVPAYSSSSLRMRVAKGQPGWEAEVPAVVAAYITEHELYRPTVTDEKACENTCETLLAALEAGQAQAIVSLDAAALASGMFSRMIICTATSARHAEALVDRVSRALKATGHNSPTVEGKGQSGWILLDAGAVVVQVMDEQARTHYNLEELWGGLGKLGFGPRTHGEC